jgi:hypothetical protein
MHASSNPTMTDFQPFQPIQRFQPYLSPGERVLWSGRPKQGLALSSRDALLIPFSLMWGGFAIFWNVGVWTDFKTDTADDWFFKLWGLPFLAVGLYLILGRFFHDAWIRRNLLYAVSDRRILVLRGSNITSRDIKSLPMLDFSEHRDGTGTILFDSDEGGYSMLGRRRGFGDWTLSRSANAQFFRIQNPRRVYELIRNQAQS